MTLYEYPYMLEDYIVAARTEQASTSIFLIIAWLKIFKYFTLNQRLNLLAVTISESVFDLLTVGATLFIVVISFALSGYVIFGTDLEAFKDFLSTVTSLLLLLLGEFDYLAARQENKLLFPFVSRNRSVTLCCIIINLRFSCFVYLVLCWFRYCWCDCYL